MTGPEAATAVVKSFTRTPFVKKGRKGPELILYWTNIESFASRVHGSDKSTLKFTPAANEEIVICCDNQVACALFAPCTSNKLP